MSIKSYKSKLKRIISCVVAGSLSLCACVYTDANVRDEIIANSPVESEEMITPLILHETETTTTNEITTTTNVTSSITRTTTSITTSVTTQTIVDTTIEHEDVDIEVTITEVSSEESNIDEYVDTYVEETTPVETYVVFKPSTHYIHMNTCRWCNDECYKIENTEGLEARKCSDCNPDMEIITPYEEPVPTYTDTAIQVTDYEFTILCNLVAGEYGSDSVSIYDKGAVVATVIHRMQEGTRWTNGLDATIYNVISAPYQYNGKYLSSEESSKVTQSCRDAVTYALNNMSEYEYYTNPDGTSVYMINSFTGDGVYNWFTRS